jgi:hypothetical protein
MPPTRAPSSGSNANVVVVLTVGGTNMVDNAVDVDDGTGEAEVVGTIT